MSTWSWGVGIGLLGLALAGPSARAQTVSPVYPPPYGGAALAPGSCAGGQFQTSVLPDRAFWEGLIAGAGGEVGPEGAFAWVWVCADSTDLYDPPASREDCPVECWETQGAWRDETRCAPDCLGEWKCEDARYEFARPVDAGAFYVRDAAAPGGFRPLDKGNLLDLFRTKYVLLPETCGWSGWPPPEVRTPPELPYWVLAWGQRHGTPLGVLALGPSEIGAILQCVEGGR